MQQQQHNGMTMLMLLRMFRVDRQGDGKYVGPPYCRAEMYACRVACCPLASHGEYAAGTDRRTDARPLIYYAFRYGRGERNKCHVRRIHPIDIYTHWPQNRFRQYSTRHASDKKIDCLQRPLFAGAWTSV